MANFETLKKRDYIPLLLNFSTWLLFIESIHGTKRGNCNMYDLNINYAVSFPHANSIKKLQQQTLHYLQINNKMVLPIQIDLDHFNFTLFFCC